MRSRTQLEVHYLDIDHLSIFSSYTPLLLHLTSIALKKNHFNLNIKPCQSLSKAARIAWQAFNKHQISEVVKVHIAGHISFQLQGIAKTCLDH